MKRTIDLEFITPLFSHGATDLPEIRPASIRGQLHAWFRILGGDIETERRIFGGIKQGKADSQIMPSKNETLASKIVVRVCDVQGQVQEQPTLPHKQGGMAAPRKAYNAGTKCRIMITDRLGGLSENDVSLLNQTVDAWLLMGTLGYRATRGAGSFAWKDDSFPMPTTSHEYEDACRNLFGEPSIHKVHKVAVLEKEYASAETARRDVSDSLGGRDHRDDQNDLAALHNPLGRVFGGRKTSPLKYRVVRFGNKYRILAFWDGRPEVTGNSEDDFYGIVELLARRKPAIGEQLKARFG